MTAVRALPLSLLCCSCASGCVSYYDPCFVPQSIVSDLRILAVRADPPEVVFEPGGAIPPVQVRALVASREGRPAARLQGSLCAPNPDGSCAGPSVEAGGASGVRGDISFTVVATPALLAQATSSDPLRGYGGIRLQLTLTATGDGSTATAQKLLLYSPARPGYTPNHGLEVSSVDLTYQGKLVSNSATVSAFDLRVGESYGLRPLLAPGDGALDAAEEYDVADLSGKLVHLREHITYSFYTTPHLIYGNVRTLAGNVVGTYVADEDTASEPEPGAAVPANGLVHLTPLRETNGIVYVVARDGRGAVAWRATEFSAPDRRCCSGGCPPYGKGCAFLEFNCH